jgi:hypothetical protein
MSGSIGKSKKRFWLAISVRLLLFLICLLALALAPVVNRAFEQRRAVSVIRQNGGTVSTSPRWGSDWIPTFVSGWIGEEYFEEVYGVDFESSSHLTSDQLSVLPRVGQLTQLHLILQR